MFYEEQHFGTDNEFTFRKNDNLSYPVHLHRCFEFVAVSDGDIEVIIDNKPYFLKQGDSVLIFPHQKHSYDTKKFSNIALLLFSPDLVRHFSLSLGGKIPKSNRITVSKSTMEDLCFENIYQKKAFLYHLCGEMCRQTVFEEQSRLKDGLSVLDRALLFVEEHLGEVCTLKELSKTLTYDYSYLSKLFIKETGMRFNEYVNKSRVALACYMLKNSGATITNIAAECGYDSMRSFNREFKKHCDVTPTEYRTISADGREQGIPNG